MSHQGSKETGPYLLTQKDDLIGQSSRILTISLARGFSDKASYEIGKLMAMDLVKEALDLEGL
jgi:hypothetical protein